MFLFEVGMGVQQVQLKSEVKVVKVVIVIKRFFIIKLDIVYFEMFVVM